MVCRIAKWREHATENKGVRKQESGLKDEKAASVAIKRLRAVNGGLGMQLRGESIRITNELHSEG